MALPNNKPTPSRYIGIDYGLVRIGVAVSDETKCIAAPLTIIKAEKKSGATITKLKTVLESHQKLMGYQIEGIVIGMPLLMSGKIGIQADEVKHFIELLQAEFSIPIIAWDERLTTVQAERSLREGGLTRKKRAKVVDSVAAIIILQNYLDYLRK